jgi:hypothetical protein
MRLDYFENGKTTDDHMIVCFVFRVRDWGNADPSLSCHSEAPQVPKDLVYGYQRYGKNEKRDASRSADSWLSMTIHTLQEKSSLLLSTSPAG